MSGSATWETSKSVETLKIDALLILEIYRTCLESRTVLYKGFTEKTHKKYQKNTIELIAP
jgi:hypothetical protein